VAGQAIDQAVTLRIEACSAARRAKTHPLGSPVLRRGDNLPAKYRGLEIGREQVVGGNDDMAVPHMPIVCVARWTDPARTASFCRNVGLGLVMILPKGENGLDHAVTCGRSSCRYLIRHGSVGL
jgi:hypothetical protein